MVGGGAWLENHGRITGVSFGKPLIGKEEQDKIVEIARK